MQTSQWLQYFLGFYQIPQLLTVLLPGIPCGKPVARGTYFGNHSLQLNHTAVKQYKHYTQVYAHCITCISKKLSSLFLVSTETDDMQQNKVCIYFICVAAAN